MAGNGLTCWQYRGGADGNQPLIGTDTAFLHNIAAWQWAICHKGRFFTSFLRRPPATRTQAAGTALSIEFAQRLRVTFP
jgi:hypothetical protein